MNQKLIETVTKISSETAAQIAVQAALEYLEKEKQKQQKEKRDRRLRNTKLLLKNYRSFLIHCDDLKIELESLPDPEFLEELDSNEFAIESIRRSKKRTIALVNFVKQMMEVYRILCERSNRPDEIRRYKVIEMRYISDEEFSIEQIAEGQKIDVRTVYKDINKACKTLSALMFGVDGVRMFE